MMIHQANQDNPEYNPPQYDRSNNKPEQPDQYTPASPEKKPERQDEDGHSQDTEQYHPSEKKNK